MPAASEVADLPKMVRIHSSANQGPLPVNVWTQISLDVLEYNFGAYTYKATGGFWELVIPEPGLYTITVNTNTNLVAANGIMGVAACYNGVGPVTTGPVTNGPATNLSGPIQASSPAFLNEGTRVGLMALSNIAASALGVWTWMSIQKERG